MKPKDYVEQSAKTLAGQTEEKRYLDKERLLHRLSRIYSSGIDCDFTKRVWYYNSNMLDADDRRQKDHKIFNDYSMKIRKLIEDDNIQLSQKQMDEIHGLLGISSELSELTLALMKQYAGEEVDSVNVEEELGDLLWYIAIFIRVHGLDMEKIMQKNIDKLSARFPDKFTTEKAQNRDLEKEREILEKS